MVGRTGAGAERSNVSTVSGAAGIHPQTGWEAAAVRGAHHRWTVQTAAVLVLEPIFEADLEPEQYAYRKDRSALDAVRHVHKLINTGHGEIVDADLSGYFDSIPHAELLKSVARRVVDGAMLHLIRMWLEAPVEETDEHGNKHRSTRNRDEGRGTPQGAPISPLLSNLYMRRFVLGWKKLGHEKRFGACIVNYADDLVICCRGSAEDALAARRGIMQKLKLTVNETKTRVCTLPGEKFDFLGYTFGRCYSPQTGRAYLGTVRSKKRVSRICEAISSETGRNKTLLDQETVVGTLNRMMTGWANYFCLGPVSKACRAVERHAQKRLRQWLCAKHKVSWPVRDRNPSSADRRTRDGRTPAASVCGGSQAPCCHDAAKRLRSLYNPADYPPWRMLPASSGSPGNTSASAFQTSSRASRERCGSRSARRPLNGWRKPQPRFRWSCASRWQSSCSTWPTG
jgi:group II intron reverse transcriptase/maturase